MISLGRIITLEVCITKRGIRLLKHSKRPMETICLADVNPIVKDRKFDHVWIDLTLRNRVIFDNIHDKDKPKQKDQTYFHSCTGQNLFKNNPLKTKKLSLMQCNKSGKRIVMFFNKN